MIICNKTYYSAFMMSETQQFLGCISEDTDAIEVKRIFKSLL